MASSPSYNAEDVTSGAELALWIWQQYQDTGQPQLPADVLPADGAGGRVPARLPEARLGRLPARRRQRPRDPVGGAGPDHDLAADQALFPATVSAATLLNTDSSLVAQLKTAEGEIEPYARTDAATLTPAAERAADLRVRDRQRRRRRHRRDRGLLPALGDDPQQREHRPGADLALGRHRRQHHGQRRQPDRAGRPHLQLPAQREHQRLELRRGRRRPARHARQVAVRPGRQHREVPGLHLRPGRFTAGPRATSRTSSSPPTSPPRWTRPWRPTTTAPCASPRPGRRAGTPRAPSTSRAAPRSTCRSRAASSPPPPSRRARPRP